MSIHTCQIARGFFIQRVCGREGTMECEECGKLFCSKHRARQVGNVVLCIECGAAKTGVDAPKGKEGDEHLWENDHSYAYRMRHRYHGSYLPYWYGYHSHDGGDRPLQERPEEKTVGGLESSLEESESGFEDFEVEADDDDISAFDS